MGYREKVKEHCALAGKRSEQLFEWEVGAIQAVFVVF